MYARSTSTPCTFIVTSQSPMQMPNSAIVAPKYQTEVEKDTSTTKTMQARLETRSVVLAEIFAIRRGANARPIKAEKPKKSRMMPSSPSVAPVMFLSAGMREVTSP